jgi:hypothetical protein
MELLSRHQLQEIYQGCVMRPEKPPTVIVPINEHFVAEVQTEFTIPLSAEIGGKISAVLECEDDRFSTLCQVAGLDLKTDFVGANLNKVEFINESAAIEGANFRRASLIESGWEGTSMKGMLLEGINLTGALGLTEEKLALAYLDDKTILPDGLSREKIQALHAAHNLPIAPFEARPEERSITIQVPAVLHRKM